MDDLKRVVAEQALKNPEKVFLYFKDRKITYRELDRLSNRYARAFQSLGVRKGDHVAVMLPNCTEWIASWFGLAKLGAVVVAFNTQWKADALEYALAQADVRFCLAGAEYREELNKARKSPDLVQAILDRASSAARSAGDFSAVLARSSETEPDGESPRGRDPLIITYTSGTTGMPKAVLNPHRAYIAGAEELRDYVELDSRDIIYSSLPLYHANPQVYCVLTALVAGGSVAVAERFSASLFWQEVRAFRATAFSYVGAVLPILLAQPEKEGDKETTARKCFGGGAPREVHEAVTRRFGVKVCELYGMSETGTWNTINRPGEIRPGSVGKARGSFELKIFDDEDNELPPGKVGEIVLRPRRPFIMFHGYYKMPEETLKDSRNLWFHTGDLGRVDSDGYYYFCGRKKESIRRGGENITPYEIEKILTGHPAVAEAAAVGVPDPVLGEEIKVYLVLRDGASVRPESLIELCREKLASFMVPRYVEFVPRLPKTGSEKVQKVALKERGVGGAWDRLGRNGSDWEDDRYLGKKRKGGSS